MTKKIKKQGDKFILSIDKKILEELHIDEKTELEIVSKENGFFVKPINSRDKQVKKIGKEVIEEYSDLFKRLSKT